MFGLAVLFAVLCIIFGILGFAATAAWAVAKVLFWVFLALFVVSLLGVMVAVSAGAADGSARATARQTIRCSIFMTYLWAIGKGRALSFRECLPGDAFGEEANSASV